MSAELNAHLETLAAMVKREEDEYTAAEAKAKAMQATADGHLCRARQARSLHDAIAQFLGKPSYGNRPDF